MTHGGRWQSREETVMKKHYETPEVVELGAAQTLTLGTTGDCPDNCSCNVKPSTDE
jgi:hypothetical protein